MDKFEKLVKSIMADAEKDGEPVTREEAEEMARMEMGEKEIRRYEQKEPTKRKANKVRKVDEEKKRLLMDTKTLLEGLGANITEVQTETEIKFTFNGSNYTMKLTKHRKKEV